MTCPPLTGRVLLKLNASKVQLPPTHKPEMEVQAESTCPMSTGPFFSGHPELWCVAKRSELGAFEVTMFAEGAGTPLEGATLTTPYWGLPFDPEN